jgi:hypothetical protein
LTTLHIEPASNPTTGRKVIYLPRWLFEAARRYQRENAIVHGAEALRILVNDGLRRHSHESPL